MTTRPFYITTPIYYVNDRPHVGTAYSTIAADVFARYHRIRGAKTHFLTGLDEHGLKLERRAQEEGLTPKAFVDKMAPPFVAAWDALGCRYDDFIRTTESRHEDRVRELWRIVRDRGDIYLGEYEDWYCVGCETFYTEKDLLPGNVCPQHKKPVERVKEKTYFFKLSNYTDKLLAFYEAHPHFVRPEGRFNEVKSFVKEGLRDLSISRASFRWGVQVPEDPEHVMYVWFDALANYITALGGPNTPGQAPEDLFNTFWAPTANAVHLVGKDILRFHAVYWPAFLLAAGVEPPTQIWAHGWLTVNGEKMSKSLGNFIQPEPIAEAIGADVLRYYLMREIAFGQDGDFSHANLLSRYYGDLGNGLGNLLNRMVSSIVKDTLGGVVPKVRREELQDLDLALIQTAERVADEARTHMNSFAPHKALDVIWELVAATNRYVDQTAPWTLAKEYAAAKAVAAPGQSLRLEQVAYAVLESLRWLSVMLWPVMPSKSDALRAQLGLGPVLPTEQLDLWPSVWGGLVPGTHTRPAAPLFPRFDKPQEAAVLERMGAPSQAPATPTTAKPPKKQNEKKMSTEPSRLAAEPARATSGTPESKPATPFTIDDFSRAELKLGLVLSAERVPKSDKLLRLQVDVGEAAPRQILAGIGKTYEPEKLVGTKLVVLANLPPRKIMGLESHGMVLAASDEHSLSVLRVEADVAPGSRVK